jgi:hypothetical protein
MSTELTIVERAVAAFDEKEEELRELAARSSDITAITNKAGYEQVHAARVALKARRVEIAKHGKAVRDEATKFSKAVIAQEDRLIAIIEPEEKRLARLQDAHDAEQLRISVEKAEAEQRRVDGLRARVEAIRCLPDDCWMKTAAEIQATLDAAKATAVDESFQEFKEQAQSALFSAIQSLEGIHCKRLADDAEKEKLRLEREELIKLRAETERLRAAELARAAEEDRKARAANEAEMARQAEELRKQRAEQEAAARAEREKNAAEQKRLAAERAEFERAQAEARKVKEAEERRRAEQARIANMKPPADSEIVQVLGQHYNVPEYKVREWLRAFDWSSAA